MWSAEVVPGPFWLQSVGHIVRFVHGRWLLAPRTHFLCSATERERSSSSMLSTKSKAQKDRC